MKRATSPLALAFVLVGLAIAPAHADERPLMLHNPKSEALPGRPLVIDGTLVDADQIDRVVLHYRTGEGPWHTMPMELQYGDLYRAVIPGSRVRPPAVDYYVDGTSFSGDRIDLFRSVDRPARVDISGSAMHEISETPIAPPPRQLPPAPAEPPPSVPPRTPPATEPEPYVPPAPRPPVRTPPARSERPPSGPPIFHRTALDDDLAAFSAGLPETAAPVPVAQPVETPKDISVLRYGQAEIRALGARTIFDVLDVVPGFTVSRDVQGFYEVAVRGIRSGPEVLFEIDGQPLNNFYDGRALANLPVDNLERIEIIRGPGTADRGEGDLLAVVNLVTDRREGARATVSGGSFGAIDGHLSAAHQLGAVSLFFDGDYARKDGYKAAIEHDALDQQTQAQGRDPGAPAGYTDDHRRLVNVGVGARFGSEDNSLTVTARFLDEHRGALVGLFDTVGPGSDLAWRAILARVAWARVFSDRFTLRLAAFGDTQRTQRHYLLSPRGFDTGLPPTDPSLLFPDGLIEQVDATTRRLGGEADAQIELATGNQLLVGAEGEQQQLTGFDFATNFTADAAPQPLGRPAGILPIDQYDPAAVKRLWLSLWAEDRWQLLQRLSLDFGFRLEGVQLPEAGAPTKQTLSLRFNPRAALSLVPLEGLRLRLEYERAFRPPTVEELAAQTPDTFYTHGQYEGNPALLPPTVDLVQLGGELVQAIAPAQVRIHASVFYENFTQPIEAVDNSGNIVPLSNREGVRVFGAEGSARVELSRRASAWINASWFRADDSETPTNFQLLTDTPQVRFNAGLTLPVGPWLEADVFSEFGAARRNDSRTVLEQIRRYSIPAYNQVTAQLRTELLADHFELSLVGHNVFDVQRDDDVPRPDRIPGLLPREGLWVSLIARAVY